jgi:hypothetical protein
MESCARVMSPKECMAAAAAASLSPASPPSFVNSLQLPAGCVTTLSKGVWNVAYNNAASPVGCAPSARDHVVGVSLAPGVNVGVELDVDKAAGLVTIVLSSNTTGRWFGVGFNASQMGDAPYAIIVFPNGTVSERRLALHEPGCNSNCTATRNPFCECMCVCKHVANPQQLQ